MTKQRIAKTRAAALDKLLLAGFFRRPWPRGRRRCYTPRIRPPAGSGALIPDDAPALVVADPQSSPLAVCGNSSALMSRRWCGSATIAAAWLTITRTHRGTCFA